VGQLGDAGGLSGAVDAGQKLLQGRQSRFRVAAGSPACYRSCRSFVLKWGKTRKRRR
jgi:hypothetical protein